jgi:hypothetical protein
MDVSDRIVPRNRWIASILSPGGWPSSQSGVPSRADIAALNRCGSLAPIPDRDGARLRRLVWHATKDACPRDGIP